MPAFSARKPPAPLAEFDITAESTKIVEFYLNEMECLGQASAGMYGSQTQELMATVQVAQVRTVLTQIISVSME